MLSVCQRVFIAFILILGSSNAIQAQVPKMFSFQVVAITPSGSLVVNKPSQVEATVRQGLGGPILFEQRSRDTSDNDGILSLMIGNGTLIRNSPSFSSVNWSLTPLWLEIQMDTSGTGQYFLAGSYQINSVPYALMSPMMPGQTPGQMLYWSGSLWLGIPTANGGGALSMCGGLPNWGQCPIQPATLSTDEAINITSRDAQIMGHISHGIHGDAVYQRGICWDTAPNPTISRRLETSGGGVGSFTVTLRDLMSERIYYARAFAINSAGVSYGNQVIFSTIALPPLPNSTLTVQVHDIYSYAQRWGHWVSARVSGFIGDTVSDVILEKGICYSASPLATTIQRKPFTQDGDRAHVILDRLEPGKLYFIRPYVATEGGVVYGNQTTFRTRLILGQVHLGGRVGAFALPEDSTFVRGEQHGLIVAADPVNSFLVNTGGNDYGCNNVNRGTKTEYGWGKWNSNAASSCSGACSSALNYRGSGLSDWFLPSLEEGRRIWMFGGANFSGIFARSGSRQDFTSSSESSSYPTQMYHSFHHNATSKVFSCSFGCNRYQLPVRYF